MIKSMKFKYAVFKSIFGKIIPVAGRDGFVALYLEAEKNIVNERISVLWQRDDSYFSAFRKQLDAYFAGELQQFDLRFDLRGTDFQLQVWNVLQSISFAEVKSYKEVSEMVHGSGNAARAVGMACNKNPLPLIIPCHRVIGTDSKLTGYACGIELKKKILEFERNMRNKCGNVLPD